MGYFYYIPTTRYYCYDDADTSNGHTAGTHTMAEWKAAMDAYWPGIITESGGAYTVNGNLVIGHPQSSNENDTSFTMTTETIVFTGSFGFQVPSVGNLNSITIDMGTKIGTGDNSTGDGPNITVPSGSINLRGGEITCYGAVLSASAAINIGPSIGAASELCGSQLTCRIANLQPSSTGVWQLMANNNFIQRNVSAASHMITNWNAYYGTNNVLTPKAPWPRLASTNTSYLRWRDIVISATSEPTLGAEFYGSTGAEWYFLNPTWGSYATAVPHIFCYADEDNGYWMEYWQVLLRILDINGNPAPNCPVIIKDGTGTQIHAEVLSDSNGDVWFGKEWVDVVTPALPITGNHICVLKWWASGAKASVDDAEATYLGPWTMDINTGANRNATYPAQRIRFNWPFTGADRKTGQHRKLSLIVNLGALIFVECLVGLTSWIECSL